MAQALLVKIRGSLSDGHRQGLAAAVGAPDMEAILTLPAQPGITGAAGVAGAQGSTWYRAPLPPTTNPWDAAHAMLAHGAGFAATGSMQIEFVEPDIEQAWFTESPAPATALAAAACTFHPQDKSGQKAVVKDDNQWHLEDRFSQLGTARSRVARDQQQAIRIAHLDTGYDPNHASLPLHLDKQNQRNFRDSDHPNDATDRTPDGWTAVRNQGHGHATLSLLAGNEINNPAIAQGFSGFVGGAPYATVIPIRIADWVVRFSTGSMVQGFQYAVQQKVHILSMSMGGLSSRALADAVNLAYEHGVFMVTAAGNNYAWTPTPGSIVFPARFKRVLAACGVMANGRAYAGLSPRTMQGNYGPASKMQTAMGAFTPNVPWAEFGCGNLVSMDGAGTSSATPQLAAAAALWMASHQTELARYPEPWMRVEATRAALFGSAMTTTGAMDAEETLEKIGRGVLQANAALGIAPPAMDVLVKTSPAEPSWSWLNLITGAGGVSLAPDQASAVEQMLALELTQMAQRHRAVDEALPDSESGADVPAALLNRYLEAALDSGSPSAPLKAFLEKHLGRAQGAPATGPITVAEGPRIARKTKQLPTPPRRLRVYALDPSIAKQLDSVEINETVINVPWEKLEPGPVGEYLEIVDIDPASDRLYDPVDLNEPKLLAQDGWPPSEGNPAFHQQMVYAVAMKTIRNFEEALGRRVLWASRKVTGTGGQDQPHYEYHSVRRLRIYPHALRTENAYYSPDKVALLFGYFQSTSTATAATPGGSMVFACLSSDIIAHEMSHALLDGLHRSFQDASNPDVPAFHEAFADIVALFQHFSIPELVRFQVRQARGRLDAAKLLGSLAQQFGEGTNRGGPLRDYLAKGDKPSYPDELEVHARGSILVSAVYEAFLSIVDRRTADLVRIATNGSGLLPRGALLPDLVERLTEETCKTARHVLRICIRALDYCPAVDITFGEYLRALITADIDLVAVDRFHYRVAFMDAFRKRNLLPADVRTVSEESLAWGTLADTQPKWLNALVKDLDFGWDLKLDRQAIHTLNETNRKTLWDRLSRLLERHPDLYPAFGLLPDIPKYTEDGEIAEPASPGRTNFSVASVRPARRVAPDGSFFTEVVATVMQRRRVPLDPNDPQGPQIWFRGGVTLIIDPRRNHCEIRYAIVKNCGSESRLARQRQSASGGGFGALQALYFANTPSEPFALLHTHNGEFGHAH
ncbi:S8 family serine peptidase [Pseudomonas entomophila]|uniref:S8 family serine peptidase n=1 Tax=Pseudomonas entomophila TaxID=312306 RepID=UPI001F00447A|nr:S8 family serine peptidase [Pseudomonas entomophila]MCG8294483.1 S8 family serine peptidase [Pseudomonas entomophila]